MTKDSAATTKPDSPVCVEVKGLEWRDGNPLHREAIACGMHYSVRSLTGHIDGPWIAQVTTAENPYRETDILPPGPLLEMLAACQADFTRRTQELVNARSVESVRAEYLAELIADASVFPSEFAQMTAIHLRSLTEGEG